MGLWLMALAGAHAPLHRSPLKGLCEGWHVLYHHWHSIEAFPQSTSTSSTKTGIMYAAGDEEEMDAQWHCVQLTLYIVHAGWRNGYTRGPSVQMCANKQAHSSAMKASGLVCRCACISAGTSQFLFWKSPSIASHQPGMLVQKATFCRTEEVNVLRIVTRFLYYHS